jgi:hypothetical protein
MSNTETKSVLKVNLHLLHLDDMKAGGEYPPFNRTESRNKHRQDPATWAGEKQNEFGQHRRGPSARSW